jgi:putative transposase
MATPDAVFAEYPVADEGMEVDVEVEPAADVATGRAPFHPASPPSDEDVARLLATILVRGRRLLRRRGLDRDDDLIPPDPLAEESGALAAITSASVHGRIALGRRAGARVWRLGHDPEALGITSTGPRQAHLDGFDLHANLGVAATDRARLEQLCRYLLRPPVAQDRLRLTADGRVRLALKTPWADGPTLHFEADFPAEAPPGT